MIVNINSGQCNVLIGGRYQLHHTIVTILFLIICHDEQVCRKRINISTRSHDCKGILSYIMMNKSLLRGRYPQEYDFKDIVLSCHEGQAFLERKISTGS